MPGRIRKLASESAVYGISSVLTRAVGFLLFPFYSNVFLPEEYAPVVLVYATFVFLNILYQYGMESAYLRFAADSGDADGRRTVFSTAFWSLALSSVAFSTLVWLARAPVASLVGLASQWNDLVSYAAAILLLDALAVVPYAELRLSNRPWHFAAVRTANILLNVGLNLVLILGAGLGIEAVLLANVAASAAALLLLIPVLRRSLTFRIDRGAWRVMLRFALPFVPGGLGYAVTERINVFFLERMPADRVLELYGAAMPPETLAAARSGNASAASDFVVGAYGGIVKIAVLMALGAQVFRFAWQPFFLQHARDEDAPALFGRIFLLLTAAVLAAWLATSFFAAELVAVPLPGGRRLIAEPYWAALPIVPVALAGYGFQAWYYHFSAGAYLTDTTRLFVPCTLVGSALALALNVALVPRFGMLAAAWATTAAYATMALMLLALVRGRFPVPYPWRPVGLLVVSAGAAVAARSLLGGAWPLELLLLAAFGTAAGLVTVRATRATAAP